MISYELIENQASFYDWIIEPVKKKSGIKFVKTDSRIKLQDSLFVPLVGENFNGHGFLKKAIEQGASVLCSSEGFPLEVVRLAKRSGVALFSVEDTLTFYQEVARAHRLSFKNLKVIAITGSSGKTSTKEILAQLLGDDTLKTEANTNNLIGVPQNLLRLTAKHKYAVLELGTNHFGEIGRLTEICQPNIGIITTIGGAHLEFFKDRDGVAKEKTDLFVNMPEGGLAILPIVEQNQPSFQTAVKGLKVTTFGNLDSGADWVGTEKTATLTESSIVLKKSDNDPIELSWQLKGSHQAVNAAATLAVLESLDLLTPPRVIQKLTDFSLPGMRGQITHKSGFQWINDAYNANAESTIASLTWLNKVEASIEGTLHIVLGDLLELGESAKAEHQKVLNYLVTENKTENLWLVGEIYESVNTIKTARCFKDTRALKQAFYQSLNEGDTIFLKGSRGLKLELLIK
ncbi:MAG: UDP-N-acetylmuramoyl-tripeptide--D-alanyl-D-alanine ligase [Lentisphaeria bacterium]|nr:UDP-N-acetylmuramoyl-tripeptide--D-alanyl-D-alanine ligase [Lentisphaeria bacterium]